MIEITKKYKEACEKEGRTLDFTSFKAGYFSSESRNYSYVCPICGCSSGYDKSTSSCSNCNSRLIKNN